MGKAAILQNQTNIRIYNQVRIIELFKERYYLEQLKEHYNIKYASDINSRIINNILISEIIYNGILKIYIEYGLVDEKYSIYVFYWIFFNF